VLWLPDAALLLHMYVIKLVNEGENVRYQEKNGNAPPKGENMS